MRRTLGWAALAMLILPCSRAAAETGDSSGLRELVRDRTGVAIPWSANGTEDSTTADTVRLLLRGNLTEERAVRVALLNNRQLWAAFEDVGISRADYRQALLPKNPVVEGEVRFDGGQHPGELSVMQDLSSIFLAPWRRQSAGASLERANYGAASAALEAVRETRVAFYEVQAAEQMQRFWDRTAAAARAAADLALRQHEAGNVSDLEVEGRQALYEGAKIELSKSQMEALAARERLNRAMGAWGEGTGWGILDDLPEIPADTTSLVGLESVAISQRLDLAAADAEVRSVAKTISLARFSQFPELRAGVHVEREPEGSQTIGPAVELAIPLFDRGQHAVERAKAELRQAQARQAALAVEIRSEVRTARDRMIATRQLAELLPRRRAPAPPADRRANTVGVQLHARGSLSTVAGEAGRDRSPPGVRRSPTGLLDRSSGAGERAGRSLPSGPARRIGGLNDAHTTAAPGGGSLTRGRRQPARGGTPARRRRETGRAGSHRTCGARRDVARGCGPPRVHAGDHARRQHAPVEDGGRCEGVPPRGGAHPARDGARDGDQCLGLQRPDPWTDDRSGRGRPGEDSRHEQVAGADRGPLARPPLAERNGRRGGPHAASHPTGRHVRIRVQAPAARHADVPLAR